MGDGSMGNDIRAGGETGWLRSRAPASLGVCVQPPKAEVGRVCEGFERKVRDLKSEFIIETRDF